MKKPSIYEIVMAIIVLIVGLFLIVDLLMHTERITNPEILKPVCDYEKRIGVFTKSPHFYAQSAVRMTDEEYRRYCERDGE